MTTMASQILGANVHIATAFPNIKQLGSSPPQRSFFEAISFDLEYSANLK